MSIQVRRKILIRPCAFSQTVSQVRRQRLFRYDGLRKETSHTFFLRNLCEVLLQPNERAKQEKRRPGPPCSTKVTQHHGGDTSIGRASGSFGVVAPNQCHSLRGTFKSTRATNCPVSLPGVGSASCRGAKGEEPSGLTEDWPITGTSTVTCRPQVWAHASLTVVNKGPFQGQEPHFMLMQVKALGFCPLLGLDPVSHCTHQPAMCCPHGTL